MGNPFFAYISFMRISVTVKPQKKANEVVETEDGLIVSLRATPEDGKANHALICVLADHYKIPKSSVRIATGHTSRRKIVEIQKNPA